MIKPRLAITLGDPAGIGREIVQKAVNSPIIKRICSPVVFGDTIFSGHFRNTEFIPSSNDGSLLKVGRPSTKGGIIAVSAIYEATKYCMNGKAFALITAPVSKESFKMAGVKHPGHTELLASLTKSKKVVMMMACGNMHGVMVTRHIPIEKISKNIKTKDIIETVNLSVSFLKKMGKKNIKVALCGLNPHAGDNSILGFEERKFILPAYKVLKKTGTDITKPMSADSAWLKAKNGQYDLVCSMYHDQAMIPLKCIDDTKIVNVTIGLPFIRTSPGHGTAFDIVGKNKANASAMKEAILYTLHFCNV
ncbi:MAG: 4-hydroxythreonine-4-phosphate dehydrogenase PdxA [Endomicrobium sp.]|jgi:4-hydroxythreonine-4-phosphate dehydrogenase|nr:4-hydroxythreonine-4-phosphate dehydrogenase PdxA [Endomicrobium sp.]